MSENEPTYRCRQCRDEPHGWITLTCNGRHSECGRGKLHAAHPFAVRCQCWLRRNADALKSNAMNARAKAKPVSWDFLALDALEMGRYQFDNAITESHANA